MFIRTERRGGGILKGDIEDIEEGAHQDRKGDGMSANVRGINPAAKPSGTGCQECLAAGTWWFHLRRCAECGHIGCCDSSPQLHATKHFYATGHPIMRSFEPGETWFWNYETGSRVRGEKLAPPESHPKSQPVPGPTGHVPANWQSSLNE